MPTMTTRTYTREQLEALSAAVLKAQIEQKEAEDKFAMQLQAKFGGRVHVTRIHDSVEFDTSKLSAEERCEFVEMYTNFWHPEGTNADL